MRLLKIIAITSLGLCAALTISACQSGENVSPSPAWIQARQQIPPYEAAGYRMEWMDTAGSRAVLRAQRVIRSRRGDTLFWLMTQGVEAFHLNPRGETLEVLRSREAEVYPERGLFIARKEVFLRSMEGLRLETDLLIWEQNKELMTAPGWVRFETPKEQLRGEGLEYHTGRRTYRLRRLRGAVQSPLS